MQTVQLEQLGLVPRIMELASVTKKDLMARAATGLSAMSPDEQVLGERTLRYDTAMTVYTWGGIKGDGGAFS